MRRTSLLRSPIRIAFLLLALWALGQQAVSLYGPPSETSGIPSLPGIPLDKLGHFFLFLIPVLLFRCAGIGWRPLAAGFAAHAVASEIIQGVFLAERSGDPLDALADACGIAAALLAARRLPAVWPAPRQTAEDRAASGAASTPHQGSIQGAVRSD